MSSSRFRIRDTQASRKTLTDFDLSNLNRPRIRALFLPESFSAEYSARLAENKAKIAYVAPYKPLPSPSNSSSEDESSIPRAPSSPNTSANNARAKKESDGNHIIIVLEQSRGDEKFKFVSSSDITTLTGNDVVLRHADSDI